MILENELKVTLNTRVILLSSAHRAYKTEGFISLTKKITAADAFISRTAESLYGLNLPRGSYTAATDDGQYTLYFYTGEKNGRLNAGDTVFYNLTRGYLAGDGTDRKLSELLSSREFITLTVRAENAAKPDLNKLYIVPADGSGVSFPLLNSAQREIVETEDANMLVQGVAGSGKTNVCVEKIVYCACRNYGGRVLYTTFSRGLLTETKNRVGMFVSAIDELSAAFERGAVRFLGDDKKRAVENKIGILFDTDDDGGIIDSLKRVSAFLKEKVDYLLIEDVYADLFGAKPVAGEQTFTEKYIGGQKNYRLSGALEKIKHISPEIIFKEIYGMIFGKYEPSSPRKMMERGEYIAARADSFTRAECEIIYSVAADYALYLEKNGLTDNNLMSREIIEAIDSPLYSVAVVDEAQDFTQVNLCMVKKISRKMFCVGDALQMINPAYFNFGYLKRLMYGDVTGVKELKHNYRSTRTIEAITEKLGEMNVRRFGTHSFVLKGESVDSPLPSAAVFVRAENFAAGLTDARFGSVTIIVSDGRHKEELRKKLAKTEILTVAEAKGLERGTVVLADVLSDNADQWSRLEKLTLNRKTADENSVFRYYFNLFYVGVSRAKQYLFVAESNPPESFNSLLADCFETLTPDDAVKKLDEVAGGIEIGDGELCERIEQFCRLEQYENARFTADRLSDDALREEQLAHVFVHENFLRYGRVRDAGVEYWRRGMDGEARKMFMRSGDEALFPLMDACIKGGGALDVEIVKFYPLVADNEIAKKLICETVKSDLGAIKDRQRQINEILKGRKKGQ